MLVKLLLFRHILVIRPVKWSSLKKKYFTEVVVLRRFEKKTFLFKEDEVLFLHALAFCFESVMKYS